MNDLDQPIIVRKIVKGGGHHGGAWKVAYADFVTAMMAFFLLMWLLGSANQQQKAAISEYFKNPSPEEGLMPTPAPSAIQGPGGASTSAIELGGAFDLPSPRPPEETTDATPSEEALERARMEALKETLEQAVEVSASLRPFKDQVLIDVTDEGLRIQIVDKEGRPMFDVGSANLKGYTQKLLDEIGKVIRDAPNRLSITGHTDARPYTRPDYTNWELSADRANAARRILVAGGLGEHRVGRVVGLSSSVPFNDENPLDPMNRRISIILLSSQAEAALAGSPPRPN